MVKKRQIKKLLTIADGFGDSKAVPDWYPNFFKWPEIIGLMTQDLEVVNLSRYGAGNEYIIQSIRHNCTDIDVALVQWAMPNRLDLVLGNPDKFWDEQISQDPVYNNNIVDVGKDRYWISSGSNNPYVLEYHGKYIRSRQHQLRSQLFVEHAKLLLRSAGIEHGFMLSYDGEYLKESVTDFSNWIWHSPFRGMHSFRRVSKFSHLDFNYIQPVSLIQFDFVKQFIMPAFDLCWRSPKDIDAVENMLYQDHKQAMLLKNDSI